MSNSNTIVKRVTTDVDNGVKKQVIEETIISREKKERFYIAYVDKLMAFTNLKKQTQKMLVLLLSDYIMVGTNRIGLGAYERKEIAERLETSTQVVTNALKEMCDKDILKKKGDGRICSYFLNPYIFGSGSWKEIKRQRIEYITEFDFDNLEYKSVLQSTTHYHDISEDTEVKILELQETKKKDRIERLAVVELSKKDFKDFADAELAEDEEYLIGDTEKEKLW